MILIDKPYVSDFLIKTIKDNTFQIVATDVAKELIPDKNLNWISEQEAIDTYKNNPNLPIYTNSENTINWIEKNFSFSKLPNYIQVFKNKIKFRELIQDSFPNYFFKGIKYSDLDNLKLDEVVFPFIIKPAIGFFSLGVHKVDHPSEWKEILTKIKDEITAIQGFYPIEVLDTDYFIIEECIKGEEYAVDCYFNKNGEPVILNILHHVFSSGKDVSDRVYTTSQEIIENTKPIVQKFLQGISAKIILKNFPIHIEVRIDKNGFLNPIEVNPIRFGGWCTTPDLSWFAYGINSYKYFLQEKKPNWNEIFKTRQNKKYSIILLDNNSGIPTNQIASFDYDLVLNDFENPLTLRKVNFNEYPIFGILFTETSKGNEEELQQILKSNMKKYIILK